MSRKTKASIANRSIILWNCGSFKPDYHSTDTAKHVVRAPLIKPEERLRLLFV